VNKASFLFLTAGVRFAGLSNAQEDSPMRLSDIARRLPEDIWALFEPILPKVVYQGTGRYPASNHACFHGLLYVLITGIGWDYVPRGFPCGKTIQSRLRQWLTLDCFLLVWAELAQR